MILARVRHIAVGCRIRLARRRSMDRVEVLDTESRLRRLDRVLREILVHFNVEVPTSDSRSADEIADAILGAVADARKVFDEDSVRGLKVVASLAEEV